MATPRAQPPGPPAHRDITYITPLFPTVPTVAEMNAFKASIGEGPYVRLGFAAYVVIRMTDWNVDIHNPAAVRTALASTFAEVDSIVQQGVDLGVPVSLNMVTPSRDAYDAVQTASELEDRRSMQWFADNDLSAGWWSHSRYARKARAVQEAYVREFGRYLAKKMAEFPDTLVAASGDGEVELAYGKSVLWDPEHYTEETTVLADYSPFAVAEFRDWLRNGGLYALSPAGPYAGESYALASRYQGDLTPDSDEGGDGHTLNGDFGTSFTTWNLRIAEWELTDPVLADPNALALSATLPDPLDGGFDAPRVRTPGNAFWDVWYLFRQVMITHHNRDFSKWITTTPYPEGGGGGAVTVPTDRWYSYQIPADYLFGSTPAAPNFRFVTSASPLLSADVFPYGGMGITAFSINLGGTAVPPANGPYAKTLAGALPVIASLHRRWAVLEWNPSVPASTSPDVYRDEMVLIERYRPGLLVPFLWDDSGETKGTPFETELENLVQRIGNVPGGCAFSIPAAVTASALGGPANLSVSVSTTAPLTESECPWTASSDATWLHVASPTTGAGDGTVPYTMDVNDTLSARAGRITVAGFTLTVTQVGRRAVRGDFTADGHADRTLYRTTSGSWQTEGLPAAQWGLPGDIPVPGDYNGDGLNDRAVYRTASGHWFVDIPGMLPIQWGLIGDLPVPADYDGDDATDAAIYRTTGGSGVWYVRGQFTLTLGARGDLPVPADYDGDGKADPAVYRPAIGRWSIATSTSGFATVLTLQWGVPGDLPVSGDFDGDGRADLAVYRPSSATWFAVLSSGGVSIVTVGATGDIPLALDLTGDGADELVLFRPSDGTWSSHNRVTGITTSQVFGTTGDQPAAQRPRLPSTTGRDFDGDGRGDLTVFRASTGVWYTRPSSTDFAGFTQMQWGLPGDIVVPGDYDGDRRADLAVWRPDSGMWYSRLSSTGFTTFRADQWGLAGDVPVAADYDGDGRTDLAVFRPGSAIWYVKLSSTGYTQFTFDQWGVPGDVPLPGDYDGDGKADLAVFRPVSGMWYIKPSSGAFNGLILRQWGLPTDTPIAADFDGDGRTDLAVFRPDNGLWFVVDPLTGAALTPRQWGLPGDRPMAQDYDGDGIVDLAVFRPAQGMWYVQRSTGGHNAVPVGPAGRSAAHPDRERRAASVGSS